MRGWAGSGEKAEAVVVNGEVGGKQGLSERGRCRTERLAINRRMTADEGHVTRTWPLKPPFKQNQLKRYLLKKNKFNTNTSLN